MKSFTDIFIRHPVLAAVVNLVIVLVGWRALTSLPVFAIGGIALSSLDAVLATGTDGVAVIAAVWKAADVSTAVRAFIARMPGPTPPPE